MQNHLEGVICLAGNDGTGKSTLCTLLTQLFPQYLVVERSLQTSNSDLISLRKQLKHLDELTYRYAFEKERQDFWPSETIQNGNDKKLLVHWIMLDLDSSTIFKRTNKREEMSKYESKKCVEYFGFVYLELAAYYGMTVVDACPPPEAVAAQIATMITSGATQQIRQLNLKNMTLKSIQDNDIAYQITSQLKEDVVEDIVRGAVEEEIKSCEAATQFYYPQLKNVLYSQEGQLNKQIAIKLAGRWLIKSYSPQLTPQGQLSLKVKSSKHDEVIALNSPSFVYFTQGESKLVYQVRSKIKQVEEYFKERVWIILKSTIYSHTQQHTGQIEHLGEIRAIGSNLFLQMLRRNNLRHAYLAINALGIIFSRKIETNGCEIVFKKEFVGTDKHSFYGLNKEQILVRPDNTLKSGIYVRFDWRNPNHILPKYTSYVINGDPYYYVIEKAVGKQTFFNTFLKKDNVKPVGDKCISQDLVKNYIDTSKVKKAVLSLYCSFAYYCKRVNLQIIDGCFMFNKDGSIVWSQINPDCMRVKKIQSGKQRLDYDKDIWRAGGSASKEKLTQKWNLFNNLLIDYFRQNRFHETQLLETTPLSYPKNEQASRLLNSPDVLLSPEYKALFSEIADSGQKIKQVIATIDISEGRPTLVKSSVFSEHHSDNSLEAAYQHICVLPKIVLVDLDAAMNKQNNNRDRIKQIKRKGFNNVYGVGGGIRSIEALNYYLNTLSVPKAILSSNLELLNNIPKEIVQKRIIVQLSINQKNEVLTHGRTVNTGQNVIKKMIELTHKGVRIVSLTFNHKEGHLSGIPREQFRDIMFAVPGAIDKVIIAGGISSFQDLQFIWGFSKTVPQLGSAIWKKKIGVPDLLCQLVRFNPENDLCSTVITSQSGKLLGQIYLNPEALKLTAQTRYLYRFSRQLNRLIKKGQESGNTQKVVSIQLDCDNDCINVIVQDNAKPFCHLQSKSCFDYEYQHQFDQLEAMQEHIWSRRDSGTGYSKKMQQNQHFSSSKFLQECFEFVSSKNKQVQEGADTLAHFLMYLNAKQIPVRSIISQLNSRANKVRPLLDLAQGQQKAEREVQYIAVMGSKYFDRLDRAACKLIGLNIVRAKNRSLQVQMHIDDKQKFQKFFGKTHLRPMVIKSKDMSQLLLKKEVKWCFNYSIMMENHPQIWQEIAREPIPAIRLVVLKRQHKDIDPLRWSKAKKGKIASEYPFSMINYLHSLGVDQENYTIFRVSGGTQGYLQSDHFDYCDAIVETGRTLADNHLQVVKVLCDQIYGALYTLL